MLRLVLCKSGRVRAFLQLHRALGEPDFSSAQQCRLATLEPFFAHALTRKWQAGAQRTTFVDAADRSMIIVNRNGRLMRFSPHARRLLLLATHPKNQPSQTMPHWRQLPPALAGICHNLRAISAGAEAPIPAFRHRNAWGQFTFQAYWLNACATDQDLIGIHISRQVPLALGLWQGAGKLPLSRRQSEVAVLLASGLSHQQAADQLGLSRDTVICHNRWTYNKLDVHDRDSLRERLLDAQYAMV